ncbi:MAG: DUF2605 domain-containing protein [Cyanobacteria bacterium P01_C01_bin.120]
MDINFDSADRPEKPVVQAILEPLLDDFQYWFGETKQLLNSPKADCLAKRDRQDLVEELTEAEQSVGTAKTLMLATGGKAGVELSVVTQWHQLVAKCWQTSRYIRQQNSDQSHRHQQS